MQLQFNIYGFSIGMAIIIGCALIERQMKKEAVDTYLSEFFYEIGILVFVFGVIGARIWHVFTDFFMYRHNLISMFFIWNGGLSILGGVMGGIIGILISVFVLSEVRLLPPKVKKEHIFKLLDVSVFGLPVGQAIGRWGNYFNQELYGKPTSGFFKIFIDAEHRLLSYENTAYYHPLFLYEVIATGLFALVLHIAYRSKKLKRKLPQIGSGNLFLLYIFYYSLIRFFLDFLRIDTAIRYGIFGINQLVLLIVIFLILIYFLSNYLRIIARYVFKK